MKVSILKTSKGEGHEAMVQVLENGSQVCLYVPWEQAQEMELALYKTWMLGFVAGVKSSGRGE